MVTPRIAAAVLSIMANVYSAACNEGPKTRGFMIDIATAPESCGDGRNIVAIAVGSRRARLNGEADVPITELVPRLHEVLSYRAEKLVYVAAEADVSWGEFLELLDRVWPEADLVSIVTPEVKALAQRRYCLAPSCGQCIKLLSTRPR
jgi:hypothetical protein